MTVGQIVDLRNGVLMVRVVGTWLALFVFAAAYLLVLLFGLAINVVAPRL
jgi:hypothetical protein